jgi:CHAD domain-containing protein
MTERWQNFAVQASRCRRRPTEKAIHDLRVATRRLIAVVDVLRTIAPGAELAAIRKAMKQHLRAFSALRDIQVQILATRELAPRFPLMQLLRTMLMVRERLLLKQAKEEIHAIHLRDLERDLAATEHRLESLLTNPVMREVSRHMALGVLGRAYARAAVLKAGAMTGRTDRIHRFRIAFKRLRYTAEALQPILPSIDKILLKSMNAYQTRMGEIQDIQVLMATVNSFSRRHGTPSPIRSLRLKVFLMNRRSKLVSKFLASADEFEHLWPALMRGRP